MAIRTDNLTFSKLLVERLHRVVVSEFADVVEFLPSNMIELQDNDVSFATVDTATLKRPSYHRLSSLAKPLPRTFAVET
jgi:hypothetical protein